MYSFASGGLVFSIILMVVIALICLVAFQILISSQQHVLNQHLQKNVITEHESVDYGYMGQALYGPWLRYIIQAFLCISQMGFVSAYLIFISQNIGLAIDSLSNCTSPIDSKYYIWIVLLMIVPFTWVRCIDRFSIIVVMADVLILFSLICILYFTSSQIASYGPGPNIKTINVNDFALMIGTAVFSYEGIGMGKCIWSLSLSLQRASLTGIRSDTHCGRHGKPQQIPHSDERCNDHSDRYLCPYWRDGLCCLW